MFRSMSANNLSVKTAIGPARAGPGKTSGNRAKL
jgi:hypothetical protein